MLWFHDRPSWPSCLDKPSVKFPALSTTNDARKENIFFPPSASWTEIYGCIHSDYFG